MKWTALVITLMTMAPAGSNAKNLSVLDYYQMIPAKLISINPEYPSKFKIENKGGKFITQSSADYEITPTIDFKNGYLNITDEGTGGGTVIHEMAIFIDANKTRYIAANTTEHDGIGVNSKLRFYVLEAERWIDVTSKILPKLSWRDFFSGSSLKNISPVLSKEHLSKLQICYTLPRYGTTVKASISTVLFNTTVFHMGDTPKELKAAARKLIESISFKEIELNWDLKEGRLKTGNKH